MLILAVFKQLMKAMYNPCQRLKCSLPNVNCGKEQNNVEGCEIVSATCTTQILM